MVDFPLTRTSSQGKKRNFSLLSLRMRQGKKRTFSLSLRIFPQGKKQKLRYFPSSARM